MEWISVNDRLPELHFGISNAVLVVVKYGDGFCDICAGYLLDEHSDGNIKWCTYMAHNYCAVGEVINDERDKKDRVTYWTPMPDFPKD